MANKNIAKCECKKDSHGFETNLSHEMLLLLLLFLFFFSGERELSFWLWYNFANIITNGKLSTLTDILLKSSWEELISFNLFFSLCTFSQNKKEHMHIKFICKTSNVNIT